ncbi:MAG: SRPBCC family protein [Parachlamydiaceae bacterium]|nr:SRPBCC family protein [Parachlamydiaceae bacterium]
MKDIIEKRIELNAPISKVWKALTDYKQFGEWFCVNVEKPFTPGHIVRGQLTYPGYENYPWEVVVQKIEPEYLFSFTWHPYAIDIKRDYSKEKSTLVEFRLQKIEKGSLLVITESGFDKIPTERQLVAFRMNEDGWNEQIKNIERYVE